MRATKLVIALLASACLLACGHRSASPRRPGTNGPERFGDISEARLLNAAQEPDQWLAPGRDLAGSYYSPLDVINTDSVQRLGFAWDYTLGTRRGLEATPVVVDGVLYTSGNWGRVYALDAVSGQELWTYDPGVPGQYGR